MNEQKREKILLITHELRATGAPIVLFEMAKILHKKYDICVLSPEDGILSNDFKQAGMQVQICPAISEQMAEEAAKQYKMVIANTILVLVQVYKFVGRNIPVVWWIHENSPIYEGRDGLKEYYINASKNVHYYAAGKKAQQNFLNYSGILADVLEFGLDDVFLTDKAISEHEKIRFFCPSGIAYNKGQDILAGVIQLLEPNYRDKCEFIFVGDENRSQALIYAELKRLSETYDNVTLLDSMSKSEIYEMYYDMDVVVAPSREDATPATIVEGMMYHKVCLASDGTGISYYMTDGQDGFVFRSGDILHTLEKVKYIIDHFGELDVLKENGRKLYERIYSKEVFEQNVWKMSIT